MPHISIKLWPGRTEDQKKLLAKKLEEVMVETIGASERSISISIEEIEQKDWEKKVYDPEIVAKQDTLYKKPGYGKLVE